MTFEEIRTHFKIPKSLPNGTYNKGKPLYYSGLNRTLMDYIRTLDSNDPLAKWSFSIGRCYELTDVRIMIPRKIIFIKVEDEEIRLIDDDNLTCFSFHTPESKEIDYIFKNYNSCRDYCIMRNMLKEIISHRRYSFKNYLETAKYVNNQLYKFTKLFREVGFI